MHDLLPIYKVIKYIESHLCEDITVAAMADVAGYSLYHFIRTFNHVVRHTPYDYLMRRRMAEAAYQLVTSNRRVVEIAFDYCFNNPESFSRAFKRVFGMQAVQWRERGIIPRRALMPPFTYAYLEHIQLPGLQRPTLATHDQHCLAGLMTSMDKPEDVTRLWQNLGNIALTHKPELHTDRFFGVRCYLDEVDENLYYFAGFESKHPEEVGPVLTSLVLPASDYICITHEAPLAAIPLTQIYLHHTCLPKAGFQPALPIEVVAFGTTPPWSEDPAQIALWLPVKKAEAQHTPRRLNSSSALADTA